MLTIDVERAGDHFAREFLLDRVMGPERFSRPSQLLRDGRDPELALVARDGAAIVGTVRLWSVDAGGRPALLLGPLAVAPERQGEGIGSTLMRRALTRAGAAGHGAVMLVGDAPYYARFGFEAALTAMLTMPAPVDPARFLAVELRDGALLCACGPVVATDMPVSLRAPAVAWAERVAA